MTPGLIDAFNDLEATLYAMPPAAQLIVAAELARLRQERAAELDAMDDGEAVFALGQLIVDAMKAARPRIQRLAIYDPARGSA